jgi:hypothetical protein
MLLHKFVPTQEIANQVAAGVFRFYELTKYVKLKEDTGRADAAEGSISFPDDGSLDFVKKLPTASFNGVEFQCESISLSDDYLGQFFVFCMSTAKTKQAIGDCKFAVELDTDIFSTFEMFLSTSESAPEINGGAKFFSHGPIDYYDINNHPPSIEKERWREVYLKHSSFSDQEEYRAALKVSDSFIARTSTKPWILERPIFKSPDGTLLPFNFKLKFRSGVDDAGWRYVEFNVSEFLTNIAGEPSTIITFGD